MKRMMALTPESKLVLKGDVDPSAFLLLPQCSSFITEDPANAAKYLKEMNPASTVEKLVSFGIVPEDFISKIKAQSTIE